MTLPRQSIAEITTLLRRQESSHVFQQVDEDARTLRSARGAADDMGSIFSNRTSTVTDTSFRFDTEIILSAPYRNALGSRRRSGGQGGASNLPSSPENQTGQLEFKDPTFLMKAVRSTKRVVNKRQLRGALHTAARGNDLPKIVDLLGKGADIKGRDEEMRTPLHIGVESGSVAVVRLLLQNGADITACDRSGSMPIHVAIEKDHPEIVTVLLKMGAKIESEKKGNRTRPLTLAAAQGNSAMVDLLIKMGADINVRGGSAGNALQAAASNGHEAVARLLMRRGANATVLGQGKEGLAKAIVERNLIAAKLLLENHADIRDQDCDLLHIAAGAKNVEMMSLLLKSGVNKDKQDSAGRTPLHFAANVTPLHHAANVIEPVVRLLLEAGANPNIADNHGETPLHCAAGKGQESIAKMLIQNGAAIDITDKHGRTPLHRAAANGQEAGLVECLCYGGLRDHLDTQDDQGETALHIILQKHGTKGVPAIKQLMQRGARMDIRDNRGRTAWTLASERGNEQALALCLEQYKYWNDPDEDGNYAIHHAVRNGNENMLRGLLDKCWVNFTGENRQTALHMAADRGREAMVQLLLRKGADSGPIDDNRNTPLHLAAARADLGVARLLVNAGAPVRVKNNRGESPLDLAKYSDSGTNYNHRSLVQLLEPKRTRGLY